MKKDNRLGCPTQTKRTTLKRPLDDKVEQEKKKIITEEEINILAEFLDDKYNSETDAPFSVNDVYEKEENYEEDYDEENYDKEEDDGEPGMQYEADPSHEKENQSDGGNNDDAEPQEPFIFDFKFPENHE
ncbi:hypothetical protein DAPPUDRAFT_244277 [Daphnia pulex]|uniref:Uncharacterized protein n=1 Tax=Daphnia pulex TaxID=6669 RepID=E9GKL2_DAPPU|nr:hypothetical protein DAPPUDRAFT_244277 [Daphnia pulex]|eukprot:EFX80043.1 hypothetical protein DAPPUDRAFT_244277 [Daphnia pulex]